MCPAQCNHECGCFDAEGWNQTHEIGKVGGGVGCPAQCNHECGCFDVEGWNQAHGEGVGRVDWGTTHCVNSAFRNGSALLRLSTWSIAGRANATRSCKTPPRPESAARFRLSQRNSFVSAHANRGPHVPACLCLRSPRDCLFLVYSAFKGLRFVASVQSIVPSRMLLPSRGWKPSASASADKRQRVRRQPHTYRFHT